jgi:hypothetical protein
MSAAIQLFADLWGHVGPGLVLAFALPGFLIALGLVSLTAFRQVRERVRAED